MGHDFFHGWCWHAIGRHMYFVRKGDARIANHLLWQLGGLSSVSESPLQMRRV